mmetsp:Transcript_57462/g.168733  ORF Transcript_57462/g.168733 Transcript_57462/m.168733 type:complete len:227 (-) Transcript_57462:673-1353(-)
MLCLSHAVTRRRASCRAISELSTVARSFEMPSAVVFSRRAKACAEAFSSTRAESPFLSSSTSLACSSQSRMRLCRSPSFPCVPAMCSATRLPSFFSTCPRRASRASLSASARSARSRVSDLAWAALSALSSRPPPGRPLGEVASEADNIRSSCLCCSASLSVTSSRRTSTSCRTGSTSASLMPCGESRCFRESARRRCSVSWSAMASMVEAWACWIRSTRCTRAAR